MSTVMTPFGRWVVFVNLDKCSVIPLRFVLQLAHELAPADITDRFGEMVVLHHILDLQTLETHDLVLAYDGRRKLLLVSRRLSAMRVWSLASLRRAFS